MCREKDLARPVVSICIANYNGVEIVESCIDSVIQQTFTGRYEILVHDDASQDDSAKLIQTKYPNITLISSTENVGYCKSNNKLAKIAKGEYLLFLNNDAVLFENALEKMFNEAKESATDSILSVTQYDIQTNKMIDHGYFLDPFFNPIPNLNTDIKTVSMVIGACLWVSRAQWDKANGFPEWFESLAEDMYLCMFANISGQGVKMVSGSGYKHHVGYSFGGGKVKNNKLSTSYKRRRFSERNKTYVMVLFTPKLLIFPMLCVHLTALVGEGLVISAIKLNFKIWNEIYLFTFKSLWKNRYTLNSERNRVLRTNKIGFLRYFLIIRWYPHKVKLLLSHGVPIVR